MCYSIINTGWWCVGDIVVKVDLFMPRLNAVNTTVEAFSFLCVCLHLSRLNYTSEETLPFLPERWNCVPNVRPGVFPLLFFHKNSLHVRCHSWHDIFKYLFSPLQLPNPLSIFVKRYLVLWTMSFALLFKLTYCPPTQTPLTVWPILLKMFFSCGSSSRQENIRIVYLGVWFLRY